MPQPLKLPLTTVRNNLKTWEAWSSFPGQLSTSSFPRPSGQTIKLQPASMPPLSTLHFRYSGLLNCRPSKGTVRLVLPISYSWKPGAVLHSQKGKLLSTYSMGASKRQVIPHAICDPTSKGTGGEQRAELEPPLWFPATEAKKFRFRIAK